MNWAKYTSTLRPYKALSRVSRRRAAAVQIDVDRAILHCESRIARRFVHQNEIRPAVPVDVRQLEVVDRIRVELDPLDFGRREPSLAVSEEQVRDVAGTSIDDVIIAVAIDVADGHGPDAAI